MMLLLGLCTAGFSSERKIFHPCSMLITVTLISSLTTTFLVIYQTKELYYFLNFLVGFNTASVTYTLSMMVSWSHFTSMMSLTYSVRCLGYLLSPLLDTLLDQDKVDSGFVAVGVMFLSSGVYSIIAR